MSILDRSPFQADDPTSQEMLEALAHSYSTLPEIREPVAKAGIPRHQIAWQGSASSVWLEVCERAANSGLLRRLIEVVAADPRAQAYEIFAELAATPRQTHAETRSEANRLGHPPGDPVLDSKVRQLAHAIRKELENEARRWQVDRPVPMPVRWHVAGKSLRVNAENVRISPAGKSMTRGELKDLFPLFNEIGLNRLAILGKPGSGKTIYARQFANQVLGNGNFKGRVPVIFNLASWDSNSKLSFNEWLSSILVRDHPGLSHGIARRMVEEDRILPLLEGLDEMLGTGVPTHRESALVQLNTNHEDDPLILTGRVDEYATSARKAGALTGAWTIELEELTIADLKAYLPFTGNTEEAGEQWLEVLAEMEKGEPSTRVLREVLKVPLMIFLARTIYASGVDDGDPHALIDQKWDSQEELEKKLFSRFLNTVFPVPHERDVDISYATDGTVTTRRRTHYPNRKALLWLNYLARNLGGHELRWWQLAYGVPKPLSALVFGLLAAIAGGACGAAAAHFSFDLRAISLGAIAGALMGGLYGWVYLGEPPIAVRLLTRSSGKNFLIEMLKAPLYSGTGAITGWILVALVGWPLLGYGSWFLLLFIGIVAAFPPCIVQKIFDQPDRKPFWHEIAIAAGGGTLLGGTTAIVGFVARVPAGSIGHWIEAAGCYAFFLLLAFGPHAPIAVDEVVTPKSMVVLSRRHFLYFWLTIGTACGVIFGALIGPAGGIVYGTVFGLATGIGNNAWARWAVLTRGILAIQGKLPWRLLSFLDDAHDRGVLRQSGAVYMFRHRELERYAAEELDQR
ncbi:NACHT domain-containing protein [Nocardia sp. NPDC050175]|uniref:NACHT domain-containing protein n=1 Tax=Nocardia sp. NPDC050175 TaxID=3364317 RepID=UPI0037A30AD3